MKRRVIELLLVMICISSANLVFAAEKTTQGLPNKIIRDSREFTLYEPSRRSNSAEPDFSATSDQFKILRDSYRVIASDVALYIDYGHGHGSDQFVAGYVQATAPKFTAHAASYLSVDIKESRYARIFYNWGWDLAGVESDNI